MDDNLDFVRAQWSKEKAAGHWDEAYLQSQRQARRAWIQEQLRLRAEMDRETFRDKTLKS